MTKPDTVFQKAYDFFKNLTAPEWLVELLQKIQDIVFSIIMQIGKDYLDKIRAKIIEVNALPLSNEEKFKKVFDYARVELMLTLSDSNLNLIIEALVNALKKDKSI